MNTLTTLNMLTLPASNNSAMFFGSAGSTLHIQTETEPTAPNKSQPNLPGCYLPNRYHDPRNGPGLHIPFNFNSALQGGATLH